MSDIQEIQVSPETIQQPPQPAEPVAPVSASPVPVELPQVPQEAPLAPPASVAPEPATPTPPVASQPQSQPTSAPSPKSFLAKAMEAIQFRKKAKLEKIIKYVNERGSITNDQAQKLLRISDSTAQRYLSVLVKQNRLKITGNQNSRRYEPIGGSNGGN